MAGTPSRGQIVTFYTFLGGGDNPWYILVLGPNFSAQQPIKLPPSGFWCTELNVVLPFVWLSIASPIRQGLRYSVTIPRDPALRGLRLFAQAFCACKFVNGRGPWTSTSVIKFTIQ